MENLTEAGISSYYKNLERGKKDSFIVEVAEKIGITTISVRWKIKNWKWKKIEIEAVSDIINKRR